jgi:D-alanyl-D-alanine dipeptidase
MYYGNASVFLLREEKGILQIVFLSDKDNKDFSMGNVFPLKKVRFDSYTLNEEGPLMSAEAPVHFERDTEGNGIVCKIGGKRFTRNFFPGESNKILRLEANKDYQLLKDAATKAAMPAKLLQGQAARLVRIRSAVPNVKFDLRYAGADNIFGVPLYEAAEAFAEAETAAALKKAADKLAVQGYGILIWEGYRPWHVSKLASDLLPKDKKEMMPLPDKGEDRNTGRTVDVSLYDLSSGEAIKMISDFDEVSVRQFPGFAGGTERQRNLRDLLASVMKECGFTQGKEEWWHFTLGTAGGWQHLNIPYGQIQ